MTNRTETVSDFPPQKRRKVEAEFTGGYIASDGGVLLLRLIDRAKHAWVILALLVKRLCTVWLDARIVFRGDSGFCRHHILTWCGCNGVDNFVGIAKNDAVLRYIREPLQWARKLAEFTGGKQRECFWFYNAAGSWSTRRKVIAKLEFTEQSEYPCSMVTNLEGDKRQFYDEVYCARGDMARKARPLGSTESRNNSWAFCRSRQRALLVSQSVSPVTLQSGLCADVGYPLAGPEGYGIGACADDDDPEQALQDRGRDLTQYSAESFSPSLCLPLSGGCFEVAARLKLR